MQESTQFSVGLHAAQEVPRALHGRNFALTQLAGQFGDGQVMQIGSNGHGVHRQFTQ
jgi:hypothetical protein